MAKIFVTEAQMKEILRHMIKEDSNKRTNTESQLTRKVGSKCQVFENSGTVNVFSSGLIDENSK